MAARDGLGDAPCRRARKLHRWRHPRPPPATAPSRAPSARYRPPPKYLAVRPLAPTPAFSLLDDRTRFDPVAAAGRRRLRRCRGPVRRELTVRRGSRVSRVGWQQRQWNRGRRVRSRRSKSDPVRRLWNRSIRCCGQPGSCRPEWCGIPESRRGAGVGAGGGTYAGMGDVAAAGVAAGIG